MDIFSPSEFSPGSIDPAALTLPPTQPIDITSSVTGRVAADAARSSTLPSEEASVPPHPQM